MTDAKREVGAMMKFPIKHLFATVVATFLTGEIIYALPFFSASESPYLSSIGGNSLDKQSSATFSSINPAALGLTEKPIYSMHYGSSYLTLTSLNYLNAKSRNSENGKKRLSNFSFGASIPINPLISFGLSGILPDQDMARIKTHRQEDVRYLKYSDERLKPSIVTSVSFHLPYDFIIGAGLDYSAQGKGNANIEITENQMDAQVDVRLSPTYTPIFGLLWQRYTESTSFHIGLSFKQEQAPSSNLKSNIAVDLNVATLPLNIDTHMIPFYEPALTNIIFTAESTNTIYTLSITQTYWSRYRSLDLQFKGEDATLLSNNQNRSSNLNLKDTLSYSFGWEWKDPVLANLYLKSIRMGAQFHDTATSKLTETSRVIDMPRYTFGTGLSVAFPNLPEYGQTLFDTAILYSFFPRQHIASPSEYHRVSGKGLTIMGGIRHNV